MARNPAIDVTRSEQPKVAAAAGQIEIAPVRFGDLRSAAALQKRSFAPRLAYSYLTLLFLHLMPGVRFLVARTGDSIAGIAIGDRNKHQSRVVNICTDPSARRQGIATRLLRQLENELPTGDIVLMAELDNAAARALYTKEGYAELGIIRNYYGRGKDGIWMQKTRTGGKNPTSTRETI
ncbi:MAG: GNAT family N-acetyltransferase [Thermomicrobiales bacterium]|nr:GNAT family N-acetyltransferase [Thermomicrobiales bacterium]